MGNHKKRYIDESGKTYGKLKVIRYVRTGDRGALFECECECGNTVFRYGTQLRSVGEHSSCGCGRNAPRKPKADSCVVCGSDKVYAKNMCQKCYMERWKQKMERERMRYL